MRRRDGAFSPGDYPKCSLQSGDLDKARSLRPCGSRWRRAPEPREIQPGEQRLPILDVYSGVANGQPSPEIAQDNEDAIRVLMRLSLVTRTVRISEHPYAVILEKNLIQLWIGRCGV